jgi:N-acyl-L-homoserine lactone synthetase
VDALAARAQTWVAPIRIGVAESPSEREGAYRLRYQAAIDRGWRQPEDLPGGLERDEYDEHAIHVLAWDGEAIVGTCRLVLPEPGVRLPTEAAFGIRVEPHGRVVDCGRYVVAPRYTNLQHRMLAVLLARSWLELRAGGFSIACGALVSAAMIRVYRRMGLQVRILAPPRRLWGEERYPIQFDAATSVPALSDRWLGEGSGL